MIEGNGYSHLDNNRNISISQPSLNKCNSQKRNKKKYLKFKDSVDEEGEGGEKVKSLRSDISYCNISRIDLTLKNMHKRWSMID
jgi:hypothetical protein